MILTADSLKASTIRVGKGRGFVVEGSLSDIGIRYVITVGSCLPVRGEIDSEISNVRQVAPWEKVAGRVLTRISNTLDAVQNPIPPEPMWPPLTWDRKPCRNLLGQLEDEHLKISARCIFYDPISNLAVLGAPDDEEYQRISQEEAFKELTHSVTPLKIGDGSESLGWVADDVEEASISMLSLAGGLFSGTARYFPELMGASATKGSFLVLGGEKYGPNSLPAHFGDGLGKLLGSPLILSDGSVFGVLTGIQQGICLVDFLPGWFLRELMKPRESEYED